MSFVRRRALLFVALFTISCKSSNSGDTSDAATGGNPADSSVHDASTDAGQPQAGNHGGELDAGAASDSGTSTPMDAGFDAASSDASADAAVDAGGHPDEPDAHGDAANGGDDMDASTGPGTPDGGASGTPNPCGQPAVITLDGGNLAGGSTPLVDVGHSGPIRSLFRSGDRVLAADGDQVSGQSWVLWNTTSAEQVARGSSGVVGLAGSIFVTKQPVQVRAIADGHVQGSIAVIGNSVQLGVATDGSYVWGGSTTGLYAWSTTGTPLLTRAGDYSTASIFGAPDELRIARGPAGSTVIEYVALADGAQHVSAAFSGTFQAWFLEGERFLTKVGTTVWVYAKDGSQIELVALSSVPSLVGQGDYFWTFDSHLTGYPLNIYSVGGGATPIARYGLGPSSVPVALPNDVIGVADSPSAADVFHLGTTVTKTQILSPSANNISFAADSAGAWSIGSQFGVLSYGASLNDSAASGLLGCGKVTELAGSSTGRVVVATASGKMFAFDAANSTLTSEVANFDSTHAELSDDGTVLAAMNDAYTVNYPSQSVDLHVYALPQFALIHAWPGTSVNSTSPSDFRLARTGTRISRVVGHYDPSLCTRYVTDLAGATESFHDAGHCPTPRLSPSGSYIAVTDTERSPQSTTQIYHDSTLVNAVPGTAVVWFDDNTLLVQSYVVSTIAGSSYDHSTLYDHQGAMIATPVMLPRAVTDFYAISSNEIFDPTSSKIYDPATGTVIWNKGIEGGAAVAGPFVVYTARSGVFLTPH